MIGCCCDCGRMVEIGMFAVEVEYYTGDGDVWAMCAACDARYQSSKVFRSKPDNVGDDEFLDEPF